MTHLASSTIFLVIILNITFIYTSDTKNNRRTRVLMPEQFDMETTDDDLIWRRHPLFPFSRLSTTTESPTPSSQLRPINWRPGWLGSRPWVLPWRSTTTQSPLLPAAPIYISVSTIGQNPINPGISVVPASAPISGLEESNINNNNSPIIPISISLPTGINITPGENTPIKPISPASTSNICVCVNTTSQCPPQVASISTSNKLRSICKSKQLLCCSNAITTTTTESSSNISPEPQKQPVSNINSSLNVQDFSVPPNFIASSCQCLRSVSRCPYSYVALHLVTCPGITCCKPKRPSVVLTPSPTTINESCRCVLNENCQTNEKVSKQLSPFCKHPYKLCCSVDSNLIEKPTQGVVSEDTQILGSLGPTVITTPSPLPPNKNCTCVKSASLCPPQADILFDINLIDIRNALFCPKPNLICCIESELALEIIESTSQLNINPDNLDMESISQANRPVQLVTTPSPLPPNKNCTCVKSISQCPAEADVLFDINLIDIRNSFYCPKPYLVCCLSNNEAIASVIEEDTPVQSITVTTPSQLPPNKNCSCVKSASQCPQEADILYDINLIDIRKSLYCAKPNLICCTSIQLLIDTGNTSQENIEEENISQSEIPVHVVSTPSPIPANKNCTCVKSLLQCPPQADVLFNINISDLKNKFYCPKPNLICCISIEMLQVETITSQIKPTENFETENTSQSDTEINPITESQQSPLPPFKNCRCIKTASQCPPTADLIYDLHLIDIRNDLYCPKPNLICCLSSQASEIESTSQLSTTGATSQTDSSLVSQIATLATVIINSPIKPTKSNITNEDKCTCMDNPKLCPSDNLVIPEFIGVKCGRPRVWCCKQEISNFVQPGAWCHCTDSCKKHRMQDNGISQSICGTKSLCCEDASTTKPSTSVTVKPLNKCIFPRMFPAEGSCVCSERYLCNEESGAFISEVATMCPKSMISCCRALRQCGVSPRSQEIPWLAAVVTNKRELLCSAIIVHRLAVLVPTSCVIGQALSSLMVQVGVGSNACGLNIGVIIPHGELTLVLLQDYPSTTAQYFSPVCLPTSIVNFTSSVDPDNCLVIALVANRSSRGLMIRQEAVRLTENTECNAVNVLQKPNEICMKNKVDSQVEHQCAGGWGAAVVCRTNDVNHPLTLVGVQTRLRNNCARSASLLTTTHSDTWMQETLEYLSNQCTVH